MTDVMSSKSWGGEHHEHRSPCQRHDHQRPVESVESVEPERILPARRHLAPAAIITLASVTGFVGLIAVVGLWSTKRWGWLVTVILSVFNALGTISGIFLAPTVASKAISVGLIVGFGLVLVLVSLPTTRKAFAS